MKIYTEFNKDDSIIIIYSQKIKIKRIYIKKNHNSNINKLLNEFNDIGLNRLKQDKQKQQKNKKEINISSGKKNYKTKIKNQVKSLKKKNQNQILNQQKKT